MISRLRVGGVVLSTVGLCALTLVGGTVSATAGVTTSRSAARPRLAVTPAQRGSESSGAHLVTLGAQGWQVQSSAATTDWTTRSGATQDGNEISEPGFDTTGWLPVTADSAGAVGTEVEALLQNGDCPDDPSLQPVNQRTAGRNSIFYSDNLQNCFGAQQTTIGADTNPLFDVPWWFRTDFLAGTATGQDDNLVINGVVGQADVWVNGTEVATEATVEGDYTSYTFDITNLLRQGTNTLALEVYPNNPATMLTLDDVDWNQIPPDNNTGVQFPVQLHISDALAISNTYVTQDDAPDMSRSALTVHADVANNTDVPQSGTVTAAITPPGGGPRIWVAAPVTLGAGASTTVTFTPAAYPQLVIRNPQLWWPYQMGGQPLYELTAAVSAGAGISDASPAVDFGIRQVTSYLTKPSTLAPEGVRVFEINGVPFDFRAGGWSENLFLHYSASDLANQITIMKSLGINGIRTEGKEMPQNFYDQLDRAGILVDAGFQCCDDWQPFFSGHGVTAQSYHVMYESSLTIGEQLRDHPSVMDFSWSDSPPIKEQEAASLAGFSQSGFQEPIVSSAEYNPSAVIGPSGEKEGPYDWVPPDYWYDTTHSSNNANDNDPTLTNVGGSWGFDSEQGSGDTVPTMDSIKRFMSPAERAELWRDPDAHQFHTNYESASGQHSGYEFGTLDNLDTAIKNRYGRWSSLSQYVEEAQVQNYEDTRAQFEAYIDHWDNYPTPSTGTVYWQLNKGWPTLLWDLYNYDYDEAGSYFGAQQANQDLHVLYAYDTGKVSIDNLTGVRQAGLSVQSRVYNINGRVLDNRTTTGSLSLAPQQVENGVLTPRVPAATTPPTPAQTYFVELILRQHGTVVDRNVYWLSTQRDVINWHTTEGSPQADNGSPLSQYANMTALQSLPSESVRAAASTTRESGGNDVTSVTLTNPSLNKSVAFFLRADVRRGTASGTAQSGNSEVLPVSWSSNDITLWPGESETLAATYQAARLHGASPVVSLYGWNVPNAVYAAPSSQAAVAAEHAAERASGVQSFGIANGTPLTQGSAQPGAGASVTFRAMDAAGSSSAGSSSRKSGRARPAPAWKITSTANSPDTTPSTSFTQGDRADTYTLKVTNSGTAPTNGSTAVRLTDILGPNLRFASVTGSGWTCDSSSKPTIRCTETGGSRGRPVVLRPGQSYPPVTVTVRVPLGTGFGTESSSGGLHVTNAVEVSGGARSQPSASIAGPTPIVGVPELTADNAVDGAFRQGGTGRYEITVINDGGAPTNGSGSAPITATITNLPAGVTLQALQGSGWTCNLRAITSPQPEPAHSCYRSDVLPGENGEDPPITAVVSVADNAPATGTETVTVGGGGDAASPASENASTTIHQAADLNATSTHTGSFTQGGTGSYTLTVSNVDGPNAPTAGGASYGLVSLTDKLPWGLTATAMSGSGWTCDVAAVTCYREDALAAGSSYPPVTLTVSVAGNAPASVTNSVTVSGGGMTYGSGSSTSSGGQTGTDPTTIGQTGPAGTPPVAAPASALTVTSTHSGSFAQGSTGSTYTLSVSDAASAGPTTGMVTVTNTLPAGVTPTEMTGSGWTCSLAPPTLPPTATRRNAPPNTYLPDPTCYRLDTLQPGSAFPPITLTVAVADDAQPSVTSTAAVSNGGAPTVSAPDTVTTGQLPALVVTSYPESDGIVYAPFSTSAADNAYVVTVANDGYAATSGPVTFSVEFPSGLTAVAIHAPSGWWCTQTTCTTRSGTSLAAGASAQITVQVAVAANAPLSAQTQLQATGGGETPAAAIDEDNDYSTYSNGGMFTEPTYIAPQG
jgi:exo-1,4-beta-D-glucosaminidase